MAFFNGRNYTKRELLQRIGNIGSIADVRCIEYKDGFAQGMRAYEVNNGSIRFTVFIDKCMDIGEFYFNGLPLHFLAKPGITNGNWWNDGPNAVRSIMGGMMFTCGLSNVGPLQVLPNGQTQPLHGFIRNSPATNHGSRTYWQGDDFFIELSGVIRESSLFGTNLVLRRTITTKLGELSITIHDQIENESSTDQVPMMLMYHCNVGFPMLNENAKLIIDPVETHCRDQVAETGMQEESPYDFGQPVIGYSEQVFYHKLKPGQVSGDPMSGVIERSGQSCCTATLVNPDNHVALSISYNNRELPNLIQWKCKDAGNYVMGIEPSNCFPEGLHKEAQNKTLRYLAAGEIVNTGLTFTVCSGSDADAFL